MLDALTGPLLSDGGASRGEQLSNIRVVLGGAVDQRMSTVFLQDTPDHRILNTSLRLTKENKGRTLVLVSKDINLRMKAKSLGIGAEDYEADKVNNMERLYSGKRIIEHCHSDQIDLLYNGRGFVPESVFEQIDAPTANENYVLRNGSRSALAVTCNNLQQPNNLRIQPYLK